VLPNEKHEFSTGWGAAQKGRPTGCTTGRASGLHSRPKLVCGKERAGGLPFSAVRQKFTIFIWKHSSPARPSNSCYLIKRSQLQVAIKQICVINYIELPHKKILDSHKKH